jgi:hypothetical protein
MIGRRSAQHIGVDAERVVRAPWGGRTLVLGSAAPNVNGYISYGRRNVTQRLTVMMLGLTTPLLTGGPNPDQTVMRYRIGLWRNVDPSASIFLPFSSQPDEVIAEGCVRLTNGHEFLQWPAGCGPMLDADDGFLIFELSGAFNLATGVYLPVANSFGGLYGYDVNPYTGAAQVEVTER